MTRRRISSSFAPSATRALTDSACLEELRRKRHAFVRVPPGLELYAERSSFDYSKRQDIFSISSQMNMLLISQPLTHRLKMPEMTKMTKMGEILCQFSAMLGGPEAEVSAQIFEGRLLRRSESFQFDGQRND
jgi:hypothetical protein